MIVLIGCGKKKNNIECEAQYMYIGDFFITCLNYAKTFNCPIYILSAKYGLLSLNTVILPYNKTLNTMNCEESLCWSKYVKKQFDENHLKDQKAIFLCGENYYKYLLDYFKEYELPLKGLRMGYQIQYMKSKMKRRLF